jgi:hypothetical protein
MDHQPDDRSVSSGAVVAAWAIVGGLVAVSLFTSVLAPPARLPVPLTAQVADHAEGCLDETETPDGPKGSLHE